MKRKKEIIKIRVNSDEKNELKILAKAHAMSLSEYMRQAGLLQRIINRTEIEIVLELAKMNANQARLGNLLKLAIDEENQDKMVNIINEIQQTRKLVHEALFLLKEKK